MMMMMCAPQKNYESYLWSTSFFPRAKHSQSGAAGADQLDSISNQMSYISPAPPQPAQRTDTISDVLPFSIRALCLFYAVVMHGILVILPPADAIYLIITIHKSHPQSQHPPRGTHTHKKV